MGLFSKSKADDLGSEIARYEQGAPQVGAAASGFAPGSLAQEIKRPGKHERP